jgi:hypothetical protein
MAASNPEGVHAALEDAFNRESLETFEENATATDAAGWDDRPRTERDPPRDSPPFALKPRRQNRNGRQGAGDVLALTLARWVLEGTDPEANPVELDGRGTIVSRRQQDGSWLVVLENRLSPT